MEFQTIVYMLFQPDTLVMIAVMYLSVLGLLVLNDRRIREVRREGIERGFELGRIKNEVASS